MTAAENFKEAVFALINRNQDYVNRHGANFYSRTTDRIINALIVFYNQATGQDTDLEEAEKDFHIARLLDEIERLKTIIRFFNVDPGFFAEMDHRFLQLKFNKSVRDLSLPYIEPFYLMDIETDYLSFQTDISSIMTVLEGFRFALENDQSVLEKFYRGEKFNYLKKYFDIVENYPEIESGMLKKWITTDYLNGSIKTDSNASSDKERTTAEI